MHVKYQIFILAFSCKIWWVWEEYIFWQVNKYKNYQNNLQNNSKLKKFVDNALSGDRDSKTSNHQYCKPPSIKTHLWVEDKEDTASGTSAN
jgi:hypothetical protein